VVVTGRPSGVFFSKKAVLVKWLITEKAKKEHFVTILVDGINR
jgi:hypothetical protein